MASNGLLPGHETAEVGFVREGNLHIGKSADVLVIPQALSLLLWRSCSASMCKSENVPASRQTLLPLVRSDIANTGNSVHAQG